MKKLTLLSIVTMLIGNACNTHSNEWNKLIESELELAIEQVKAMNMELAPDQLPRTVDKETGELITSGSGWWCSGFYPGVLWYLYEYSADESIREIAVQRTELIEKEQYNKGTHDLGFMINNSFGQGLRIAGKEEYKKVMINGAYSLMSRYNETVGCIRSWDFGSWMFPVIIDNMMNLEYLMWAFRETGDSAFFAATISHADKTLENHFRNDFSSYHVVDYDTLSGQARLKQTHQGYSDESAWARGQAWGFYGYVTMYRETKFDRYLDQAVNIVNFMLDHPNMPDDGIPYWDFDAPDIPDSKRDASAGAILASGLLELSRYVEEDDSTRYLEEAKKILQTLSKPEYRTSLGEQQNFLLKHSVGSIPGNSEVDVPLTYADYYYVEALLRLRKLL